MQGATSPGQLAASEERAAERFALYIRTAKLICGADNGCEYVCVIRDVSATGLSLKLFHDLPHVGQMKLQLQTGEVHAVEMVWNRDRKAGFRFAREVDLERLLAETGNWPKRGLRFKVDLPAKLRTLQGVIPARLCNLSQQGASVLCDREAGETRLALDQIVRIECADLPKAVGQDIAGKVRWRDDPCYGLVLDNTFRLEDFALLVERLQGSRIQS